MSPALPYPQDFDDEPRQPEPDHQDQQGERVEGLVGSELPGSEVGERRCDDDCGDEPADQDRCPLRQLVASAHGLGTRQASALPGQGYYPPGNMPDSPSTRTRSRDLSGIPRWD